MDINRALVNSLDGLATEEFVVTFINPVTHEREVRTGDIIDLLGWILPSDTIVSVERA